MAITNAQQYQQLVNKPANGKRPGYRGDDAAYSTGAAQMGRADPGTRSGGPSGGPDRGGRDDVVRAHTLRRNQIALDNAAAKRGEAALDKLRNAEIPKSNIPIIGTYLNVFNPLLEKSKEKNIDFYKLDPRARKARAKYGLTVDGYRQYMQDRLSGNIDAAGNPIISGSDDDDSNLFLPVDTTFNTTQSSGIMDQETDTTEEDEDLRLAFRADGGIMNADIIGGAGDGNIDEMGRQMYFVGKLVKKATRAVKKIAKSPIGKIALATGIAGIPFGGGKFFGSGSLFGKAKPFLMDSIFGKVTDLGIPGQGRAVRTGGILDKALGFVRDNPFSAISAVSTLAGALTPEQEDQAQQLADNTGIDIEAARNSILQAAKENYAMDVRARGFKADGGLMRLGYQEGGDAEPVAKKTMPLLDMGGKEKDYRETGGFVDMGRMERADDVPARLSKNEFVFTADAVRNAGDGSVDKGAEVMYNMMKNLEAGGEVSEESQGLEGARRMFQTSQRLEEVL